MHTFYFGNRDRPLYGAHHPPKSTPRRHAVLLCAPLLAEQSRTHRSLVILARMLANEGFDVLRFDYSGCGDSEGSLADIVARDWQNDIVTAARELHQVSAPERLSAVAVRGGAALLAGVAELALDSVVLWDPVTSGATHLRSWVQMHRELLRYEFGRDDSGEPAAARRELLGYPLHPELVRELEALDAAGTTGVPCARGTVVSTRGQEDGVTLARAFSKSWSGRNVDFDCGWDAYMTLRQVMLPHPVLRCVVEELS